MIRRRQPRYKRKQAIRRRRMMKPKGRAMKKKYGGIKYFKESSLGVDITMPISSGGANVTDLPIKLVANLDDISNVAQFAGVGTKNALKAVFGRYCITGVKYVFIPRYTSADSTTRAADRVLYAINRDPTSPAPQGEYDLISQDDCKFTNSSRKFSIYVKHPKPVIFSTAAKGKRTPDQAPPPTGGGSPQSNQVAATLADNKWLWLPTRVLDVAGTEASNQTPDHVGADVWITCNNKTLTESYVNYTMYKTVYFAFKEQE